MKRDIISVLCLTLLVMVIVVNQGYRYKMMNEWKVIHKNTSISSTDKIIEEIFYGSDHPLLDNSILKGFILDETRTRIITSAEAKIDNDREYHLLYKLTKNDCEKLKNKRLHIKTIIKKQQYR